MKNNIVRLKNFQKTRQNDFGVEKCVILNFKIAEDVIDIAERKVYAPGLTLTVTKLVRMPKYHKK